MTPDESPIEQPEQDHIELEWTRIAEDDDSDDFELPAKACDLSGDGTCEACQ